MLRLLLGDRDRLRERLLLCDLLDRLLLGERVLVVKLGRLLPLLLLFSPLIAYVALSSVVCEFPFLLFISVLNFSLVGLGFFIQKTWCWHSKLLSQVVIGI